MAIPASLRELVILRSGNCCEYCRLSQVGQEATFHIDHVIPLAAQGKTEADNLALACVSCSLHKSAKLMANDPDTSESVQLFNPRQQSWSEHFYWEGVCVVGMTPTGRATVNALQMNRPGILAIREEEILLGRHPR
jgi:hypothetical protein